MSIPFDTLSVLKQEGNTMRDFAEMLKEIIQPTEEEIKAGEVLRDLCIQNDLEFPEQLMTIQYFTGIEPSLVVSKVNAVNTPLLENAMHVLH